MSLDTRVSEQWIDLGTVGAKAIFDMRGMVQGSVSVFSPNGLGTAVLRLQQSYDGGITGVDWSPVKTLSIAAPVTEVNAYATPTWIVYVYTAGTSAEKALVRLFATADPGQGVAR